MSRHFKASRHILLAATAMAATALAGAPANAQDSAASAGDAGGEIVVTATRQSEVLSKVPVSVAAFTQKTMDAQGVRNIADIARLTPGLRLTTLGGGDVSGNGRSIAIRGITSTSGSATTGVYLDDTPIQVRRLGNSSTNVYPQVFDLDRVEVLRGPQGTLFGAGAEGGAVRFISAQPSLTDFGVYARTEVATTENGGMSYESGAAAGGPLIKDRLGIRVSGWYRKDGGYIDRVDPNSGALLQKNANSTDNFAIRGALTWAPVDAFKATLSVFHQIQDGNGAPTYFNLLSNPSEGKFVSGRRVPQKLKDQFTLPSLNMELDLGAFSIISNTSYFDRRSSVDIDYTAFIGAVLLNGPFAYTGDEYSKAKLSDRQRNFTQEVRIQSNGLGRLGWVVGGFYSHAKQTFTQVNTDPFLNSALIRINGPTARQYALYNGVSLQDSYADSIDEQKAAFGQLTYEPFDRIKLIAGVRYADVSLTSNRIGYGPLISFQGVPFSSSQAEKPVTPKFGASFQATPNALFYTNVAKGYRIGGINGQTSTLCAPALAAIGLNGNPATFGSDSVWSYDAGFKGRLFDGLLRVDASVFKIDWKNIQREIRVAACGSGFVTNLGKAESKGFDLALDLNIARGLSLSGTLGYADARLSEDVAGPATGGVVTYFGKKGNQLPGSPWSWTVASEYRLPLDDREAYLRADYQHVGVGARPDFTIFGADSTIGASEASNQVALRLGVRSGPVDVSLFVNNLLNENPILFRSRDTTAATNSLYFEGTARPRTFGLTATFRQ